MHRSFDVLLLDISMPEVSGIELLDQLTAHGRLLPSVVFVTAYQQHALAEMCIRDSAKGYSAARIEDVCEAAGLTKGSFFHHFDSKEELALAAADYWIEGTGAFFASASYHALADPLDRLLAYVDSRKALLLSLIHISTRGKGTQRRSRCVSR